MGIFLRQAGHLRVDSADGLHGEALGVAGCWASGLLWASPSRHLCPPSPLVVLYDCSVGHGDCSRCQTATPQYDCVWCKGPHPRCVAREACGEAELVATQCPAPLIHTVRWRAGSALPYSYPWLGGGPFSGLPS